MSLKSSNRARRPPGNPKLAAAIARAAARPGGEAHAAVLARLMAAPLLIALHDLPEGLAGGPGGETAVRFLTEERGPGERILCGFTSHEALAASAPTAVGLAADPATLLDWVIASGCEGLLLDPAGPSAFVSQDDARELLGLPRRAPAGRRPGTRPESERLLHDALARLLAAGEGLAGVTVREKTTGRSVRFERGDGDTVRMVLAAAPLASDERVRAGLLFDEFAGGDDDLPAADGPPPAVTDFVVLFGGDPERAARAGVKVFAWVFGFPPGFALEVEPEEAPRD